MKRVHIDALNPPAALTILDTAAIYQYRRRYGRRRIDYGKLKQILDDERRARGWSVGSTWGMASVDKTSGASKAVINNLAAAGIKPKDYHYIYTRQFIPGKPGMKTYSMAVFIAAIAGRLTASEDVEFLVVSQDISLCRSISEVFKAFDIKFAFAFWRSVLKDEFIRLLEDGIDFVDLDDYNQELFGVSHEHQRAVFG